jgi:hypothetical protein
MGVADGVLQEVQEHLEDPVPVGEGLDRLMGQAAFQKHPPFPGQGGHQGQGLLGGLPQVQALKPQGNPRLDFGVGQDLFHQAGEAGCLLGQEAGEAPPLRLQQVRMGLQDLRQGPHRGEGGLELVGYGGQNLVLGLVQGLQALVGLGQLPPRLLEGPGVGPNLPWTPGPPPPEGPLAGPSP